MSELAQALQAVNCCCFKLTSCPIGKCGLHKNVKNVKGIILNYNGIFLTLEFVFV